METRPLKAMLAHTCLPTVCPAWAAERPWKSQTDESGKSVFLVRWRPPECHTKRQAHLLASFWPSPRCRWGRAGRWESAHGIGCQVRHHEHMCGFASSTGEGKGPSEQADNQVPTSLKQTQYFQALESSVGKIDSFYVFDKTVSFLKTYMERVLI